MHSPDQLTAAGRAKLAAARILLHETQGFLYLPVLAQTQAVAAAALAHLLSDWQGVSSFVVAWPHLPAEKFAAPPPAAATWDAARGQLLANLDHAIGVQASGAILVLDASPGDRHRLAVDSVSYLNQRREALRRNQLRLILLWPAGEAQALMAGAPDLWSMRALAPVVDAEDLAPDSAGSALATFAPLESTPSLPAKGLGALQQRQWQRWLACRELAAAELSTADALALIAALYENGDWSAVVELSEGVLRQLQSLSETGKLAESAAAFRWLSLGRAKLGDRRGALAPAQDALAIHEKLAAENFAAYAPDLATSLNNLSVRLGESGDRVGGLAAIRRAVEIREKLSAENFAAYAPALASSLNNLSNHLGESGDRAGGLAAIRRAVEIDEKLAAENFAAYAPALASSLNNLSVRLGESGDRAGGLAARERAIEVITPFALPGTPYANWLGKMEQGRQG